MKRLLTALLTVLAMASAALAQSFPQTLPAQTVFGRLGISPGPGQAIPFTTLFQNLAAGNNTYTGDVYFQSGRPWVDVRAAAFGAKGDGVTSDILAFNAAVTALQTIGGGTLYIPPGTYCVPGFAVNGSQTIRIVGASRESTSLNSCGTDSPTLTLNSSQSGLAHITVRGYNALTPSATSSAVVLGSSCGACTVSDAHIQEGYYGIDIGAADPVIDNVSVDSVYGPALARTTNGAVYFRRVALDQNWAGAVPAAGTSFSGWTGTHAYTTGTVVTITQGGHQYYIQAQSNGTSGSSQPTVLPYGAGNFTDGTTSWHIVAPTTLYGLLVDGGSSVIYNDQGDFTGPFTAGIGIKVTNGGTTPGAIYITDPAIGNGFTAGIWAQAGHDLTVRGGNIGSCILASCSGISFTDSWTGDATISDVSIIGNFNGINVAVGKNTAIIGNRIFGGGYTSPIGINVAANIGTLQITGNDLGASNTNGSLQTGINLGAGTSDFVNIGLNNFNGVIGSSVAGETGISNLTGYIERGGQITLGGPSGGSQGAGTINVKNGYYLNGSKLGARVQLTGTQDYYVNGNSGSTAACGPTGALTCSAGSDSNDCKTVSTACLTAQHVVNLIISNVDLAQNLAQINLAHNTGTTNYSFTCNQGPILGNAGFAVLGDGSSPTAVNITAPNAGNGITTRDYCIVTLKNVKILDQGSAAVGIDITQNSIVDQTNVHYGAFNSSANHMQLEGAAAKTTLISGVTIDGGAGAFVACLGNNTIDFNSAAVSIPSAVAFSTSTLFASGPCNVRGMSTGSFTGAGVAGTTGVRAIMSNGASLQASGGACASVWPGNAACQITNFAFDDGGDFTTGNIASGAMVFNVTGINFNSANTDTSISIKLPTGFTRYKIFTIGITGASGTLTTATCGVFTAAAAGGTAIVTSGTAITVSTASDGTANNMQLFSVNNVNTASYTLAGFPTLFFRVQNPQGSAATGNVTVTVVPLP